MPAPDLASLNVGELLQLYASILAQLRDRGIVRTVNNPAADYAEWLVEQSLSLTPAPASTKGYDAVAPDGTRYEIKARRLAAHSKPTRFSAIRSLKEESFDRLAAVLFNEDFSVSKAFVFPRAVVEARAFWQGHVNGWILPISDALWDDKLGEDITPHLRKVQARSAA